MPVSGRPSAHVFLWIPKASVPVVMCELILTSVRSLPVMRSREWFQIDRLSVGGERQGHVVERGGVAGRDLPIEACEQVVHDRFDFDAGEVHAEAFVHASTERFPGIPVHLVFTSVVRETFGIEMFGVGPVLRHVVSEMWHH